MSRRDFFGNAIQPVHHQRKAKVQAITTVKATKIPAIKAGLLEKTVLVIPIYNAPGDSKRCLRSYHLRTPAAVRFIVIDDCSDAYTKREVERLVKIISKERKVTLIQHPKNLMYTKVINEGFNVAFDEGADYALAINSDTLATPGWLQRMLIVAEKPEVSMVCPYMSNAVNLTLHMPPGSNYLDTAERLAAISDRRAPEAITPIGACMLMKKGSWARFGPFDEEFSPEGYGEECDYYLRQDKSAQMADDAYIYHVGHASYGASANKRQNDAAERVMVKHGVKLRALRDKARPRDPLPHLQEKIVTTRIARKQPNVCFYVKGIQMCGGMLALANVCNRLIERGINATVAYELDHFNEMRLMPMTFKPIRVSGPTPKEWLSAGGFKEGLFFATAWATGKFVKRFCQNNPGLLAAVFFQDREDLFRLPGGKLQYESSADYQDYMEIAKRRSVVNSSWVHQSLQRDFKVTPHHYIPIGVDLDMFYDRGLRAARKPLRIIAFSRPSTPRRGFAMLAKLLAEVYRVYGDQVEIVTYDQHPGPDVVCKHLGKLPQTRLAAEMATADILIESSSSQGWGMPAQEMMATGGCVISTDNGGIHNYGVHEQNCLIGGRTYEEMLVQLSRAIKDAGLRKQLGEQARKDISSLSWEKIAEKWETVVREWTH